MKKIAYVSLLLLSLVLLILVIGCSTENAEQQVVSDFPKVTEPYHLEQAIQNGDVVNIHGKYYNFEKWKTFLNSMESNKPNEVRITHYTIEGDPIFYELTYDGNSIHYTFDNSKDSYGSDLGRPNTSCKKVDKKKTEEGHEGYVLTGCDSPKTGDTFWMDLLRD